MAEKLMQYYKWTQEEGGLTAKVHLAQKTKIPSVNAALAEDSPENIRKFREVIRELLHKDPPVF